MFSGKCPKENILVSRTKVETQVSRFFDSLKVMYLCLRRFVINKVPIVLHLPVCQSIQLLSQRCPNVCIYAGVISGFRQAL